MLEGALPPAPPAVDEGPAVLGQAEFDAAIVRGDVSYADFVAFQQGSTDPAMLRRFLRAMRLDPSALKT